MKTILFILFSTCLIINAYATLTPGNFPVTNTGGLLPTLQDSSINQGTYTNGKLCTYTSSGAVLNCTTTIPTECSTAACTLNASTTANGNTICTTGSICSGYQASGSYITGPAGSSPQLQYNNSSAFGGVSGSGVDSSGNVGLGSAVPGQKLDVSGSIRSVSTNSHIFGSDNKASISGVSATNPGLKFVTNNLERMRIEHIGNVGVGTVNPHGQFEVVETVLDTGEIRSVNNQNTTTANARLVACTLNECGYLYKTDSNYTNITGWASVFAFQAGGPGGMVLSASYPSTGNIQFETGGTGSSFRKMTLSSKGDLTMVSGGNIGISSATPGQAIDIVGTSSKIRMRSADGTVWNCQPANSTGVFTCT